MQRTWVAAIAVWVAAGSPAQAQTLVPGPAEPPPAGYSAREYVDSTGCVFERAGVSGAVLWVPRVGADRKPVCGQASSLGGTAAAAVPEAETQAVAAEKVAAPVPATRSTPETGKAPDLTLSGTETVALSQTRCPNRSGTAQRYLLSNGGRVTKCGPAAQDGLAFLNGLGVSGLQVSGAGGLAAPAAGYRLVWTSGALRPAPAETLPEALQGKRWVQIGAFARAENASAALAAIRALGLAAAHQDLSGAKRLTAVLAGPFATAKDLAAALDRLRRAGYAGAFARD